MIYELLFPNLLLILLFTDATRGSVLVFFMIFLLLSVYIYMGLIFLWILCYFPSRAILYLLLLGASEIKEVIFYLIF